MNTDAVCPHCALLCDDLRLEERVDLSFKAGRTACPRAAAAYAEPPIAAQALREGTPVELDAAINEAARLLKRSRQPLFAGLATDVDGIRACVDLAERCNGTLDHVHGDAGQ